MGINYVTVPQTIQPYSGTLTSFSGSAAVASAVAVPANPDRKYLLIQNVHQSNTMWVNFTTAATVAQPSIKLSPGASLVFESSFITTEAVAVIRQGGSDVPYTIKEG